MCGITGIAFSQQHLHAINHMSNELTHRGPDSCGSWSDNTHVALGHRRLAIIDLSEAGHQPMRSPSGRYFLTFNGEIYNFLDLKKQLLDMGYQFKGHSDAEVLVATLEKYGFEKTLPMLNGMFAFALWDNEEKTLFLATDRFGEKPLYYSWIDGAFIFASELKAFKKYPAWQQPDIDQKALSLYLRYLYIPAPYTIFKGIKKISPASFLIVRQGGTQIEGQYWSSINTALMHRQNQIQISENQMITELDQKLTQSVKIRQAADVPLGAFLSGGIDSSLIVALMQKNSSTKVKTFTIGFSDSTHNEAPYAKQVAAHLKTDHTEIYINNEQILNIIPRLTHAYDEPFADSSQIPTLLVSQIAKKYVTVCLAGDGGDELFGGYNRYLFNDRFNKMLKLLPHFVRKSLSRIILKISEPHWDKLYYKLLRGSSHQVFGNKMHKIGKMLPAKNLMVAGYQSMLSAVEPHHYLHNQAELDYMDVNENLLSNLDHTSWMMLNDTMGYLPGDVLTKVDRASMSVSLESRLPYLDPDVFCYAWALPLNMKIHQGKTKWLLRKVLEQYLPNTLIDRPKMGFGAPINNWLRGILRDWADDLLSPEKIKKNNFFKATELHALWKAHLRGDSNYASQLWPFLMFQAWFDKTNN